MNALTMENMNLLIVLTGEMISLIVVIIISSQSIVYGVDIQ